MHLLPSALSDLGAIDRTCRAGKLLDLLCAKRFEFYSRGYTWLRETQYDVVSISVTQKLLIFKTILVGTGGIVTEEKKKRRASISNE